MDLQAKHGINWHSDHKAALNISDFWPVDRETGND